MRLFALCLCRCVVCRLEHQLLQWLASLDLVAAADAPDWSCVSSDLASGVLLAEVAAAVGAGAAVGIQERPVTAAARASNIQAALDVLQHVLPGLSRWGVASDGLACWQSCFGEKIEGREGKERGVAQTRQCRSCLVKCRDGPAPLPSASAFIWSRFTRLRDCNPWAATHP